MPRRTGSRGPPPRSPRAWTGGRGDNPAARRGFFFFFGYRGVSKSAYGGRGNPNLLFQKVREAPICVSDDVATSDARTKTHSYHTKTT